MPHGNPLTLLPDSHCHILEYGASRQIPLDRATTLEGTDPTFMLCSLLTVEYRDHISRQRLHLG